MTQITLISRTIVGSTFHATASLVGIASVVEKGARQAQRLQHSPSFSSSRLWFYTTPPISHTVRSQTDILRWQSPILKPKNHSLKSLSHIERRHFTATGQPSSTSNEAKQSPGSGGQPSIKKNRRFPKKTASLLAIVASISLWATLQSTDEDGNPRNIPLEWAVGKPLNKHSFVPFTIIAREQVSPTSFIITVKPKYARDQATASADPVWYHAFLPRFIKELHSNRDVLEKAWEYGLWAVEFKQPQLQVAREYTPLPAPYDEQQADLDRGYLRFLIRKMDGGEVSTYLSGLRVGDDVELRGPHLGFDLHARLGAADKVVFLAGGTGIAPALQVVRALLDGKGETASKTPSVSIIWANRKRADCGECEGVSALVNPHVKGAQEQDNNAVLSLLSQARARHGDNVKYACTVDEEGSFITAGAIADAVGLLSPPSQGITGSLLSSFWPNKDTVSPPSTQTPTDNRNTCPYHSAARLITSDSSDDSAISAATTTTTTTNSSTAKCQCHPEGGKNLLIVSGPEGFISAFVGPKLWANRKELQGPVRGVVGNTLKKKDLEFWKNWLVLKM